MARSVTSLRAAEEAECADLALEELIGYNLKRAYVIFHTDFREALGDDGLSQRAFSALSLVVQIPNITQSEVARRLGIERSGLVAIVDDLERRGFLQRGRVPGDRRVQALLATDTGRRAFAEAVAAVRAHEEKVLAGLSKAERAQLLTLLRKIRTTAGGES